MGVTETNARRKIKEKGIKMALLLNEGERERKRNERGKIFSNLRREKKYPKVIIILTWIFSLWEEADDEFPMRKENLQTDFRRFIDSKPVFSRVLERVFWLCVSQSCRSFIACRSTVQTGFGHQPAATSGQRRAKVCDKHANVKSNGVLKPSLLFVLIGLFYLSSLADFDFYGVSLFRKWNFLRLISRSFSLNLVCDNN